MYLQEKTLSYIGVNTVYDLTDHDNCMHVVYFTIWYEMIQATARASTFVRAIEDLALRAQPLR